MLLMLMSVLHWPSLDFALLVACFTIFKTFRSGLRLPYFTVALPYYLVASIRTLPLQSSHARYHLQLCLRSEDVGLAASHPSRLTRRPSAQCQSTISASSALWTVCPTAVVVQDWSVACWNNTTRPLQPPTMVLPLLPNRPPAPRRSRR